MKSIRIILLAVSLTVTASAWAQNGRAEHQNNWFVGAGAGINFGFDGQKYNGREFSHNGAGTAADFYIGKYFSDRLGFRVGYQGFKISNHFTDYGRDNFHYAHADFIFRAGNLFTPYVHAGYAHLANGTPAAGLGFMLPIQVGRRVSIVPDFKATAFNGAAFSDGIRKLGINLSATIGIQIALGSVKKAAAAPAVPAEPVQYTEIASTRKEEVTPAEKAEDKAEERVEEKVVEEVREYPSFTGTAFFEFNSYTIDASAKTVLDAALAFLRKYPDSAVRIEGHADNTGSEQFNLTLSAERAQNVADYFVRMGIEPSRIHCEGYGETRPAVPNDTPTGRARNRRVEIIIKTR